VSKCIDMTYHVNSFDVVVGPVLLIVATYLIASSYELVPVHGPLLPSDHVHQNESTFAYVRCFTDGIERSMLPSGAEFQSDYTTYKLHRLNLGRIAADSSVEDRLVVNL
jgi:hypothetical protein